MTREQDIRTQMSALLFRLIDQTLAGKIRWRETDRENHFLYSGSKSSVTISRRCEGYDDPEFEMALLNSQGTEVEVLHEEWIIEEDNDRKPRPWNSGLERLFELARREAMGIDSLLESTMTDIEHGFNSTPSPPKKPFGQVDSSWPEEPPF